MKEQPCPTPLLVPAVILVVLDVRNATASAMRTASNGTTTTTGNDVLIPIERTASTAAPAGVDYAQRSWRRTRCVRRASWTDASLRRTRSITGHRSNTEAIRGAGTTCNRSADRVIRARARRKGHDGTTGRDTGGD